LGKAAGIKLERCRETSGFATLPLFMKTGLVKFAGP